MIEAIKSFIQKSKLHLKGTSPAWSVGIYRFVFGILLLILTLRYLVYGWLPKYFLNPSFHFKFFGFSWVHVLPAWLLYPLFFLLALCSIGIALGVLYRACIVIYFFGFVYFNLIDVTVYLNHYYLIALLLWILFWIPADKSLSVSHFLESFRQGRWTVPRIPTWGLWILRFQIGCVYFFGGLAKIVPDWLFQAQPLRIWLLRNTDFPILGSFFSMPIAGYLFSYLGLFFDLFVPFLLLSKRFKLFGYSLVLIFHLITWRLFPIGMFPWVMICNATLFLSPSWPLKLRNFLKRRVLFPYGGPRNLFYFVWEKLPFRIRYRFGKLILKILSVFENLNAWGHNLSSRLPHLLSFPPRLAAGFWISYVSLQLFLPVRHFLYPGNHLWTEQGFRFAWHIMLIQKNGIASFRVLNLRTGEQQFVLPETYLSEMQKTMMSTQPDLILQFAHYIGKLEMERTGDSVAVFADVTVSLNGKRSRIFIDPKRDLMKVEEGFLHKDWILPED
ncbi:gamma-glutamyl carboxylase [Leptospira perolatii]|uniref:Gamma-glutamyl carboxylase n=1 Tax=Leptospira perolatii TaxID=2023191 RepID=A0A2M9ZSI1_9LEPT|nr:HTTM domain-containing protein [Leptospira perolatii]PJZ71492.1 gamma-glutamyl carboxylase [Leptospira perolatii]PJZ75026.1 gamma-glutamyl carboxylase [Leptospira perolatii]